MRIRAQNNQTIKAQLPSQGAQHKNCQTNSAAAASMTANEPLYSEPQILDRLSGLTYHGFVGL